MEILQEHAANIKRLQQLDPQEIISIKIKNLVQAVKNKELTVDDVLRYTNINEEQLNLLLKK